MRVTFQNNRFEVIKCSFENRHLLKAAKFSFDSFEKVWYTSHLGIASRLRSYFDDTALEEIKKRTITLEPWTGVIPYPKNRKPKGYQIEHAVPFALSRNRSFLALDPGLGKTICAALIRNALSTHTVYICPPFLKSDVETKIGEWDLKGGPLLIVKDSMLLKETSLQAIELFLKPCKGKKILFVDEAHRFKNLDAKRTKILFSKITPLFDKVIYLSGTPLLNRPIELFPVVSNSAHEAIDFKSYFQYGLKYCAGYQDDYGWNFSGASNQKELFSKVKENFMLRIRKKDVLKELGDVTTNIISIGERLPIQLGKFEKQIINSIPKEDLMKEVIASRVGRGKANLPIATYSRVLGNFKAKAAIDVIENMLEETSDSFLIFARHKEAIRILEEGLKKYKPFVITGDTLTSKRSEIQRTFQISKTRRLVIGNIQAMGVGFDFTKANQVVFVEFSWVPGENQQAIDRAHRIGQNKYVLAHYLIFENSLDKKVLEAILRKNQIINEL